MSEQLDAKARSHARPRLFASRCLGFEACRWNAVSIRDDLVDALKPHVEFVTECPELRIGLGVPRDPIRIIMVGGSRRLYQPRTGEDVTERMESFASSFLERLGPVDGFLLKSRSPSCGIKDVKIYPGEGAGSPSGKGAGFFGAAASGMYPGVPIEDEGRLTNLRIRDHFLTRVFLSASLRECTASGKPGELVRFHSRQKYLLMAFSQEGLRALGRIVANHDRVPAAENAVRYRVALAKATASPAATPSTINALMHVFGYMSDGLSSREKRFFERLLDDLRSGHVPLVTVTQVLRGWVERFRPEYLLEQSLFEPYPVDLVRFVDSGREFR